ncbi:hypothetical protein ACIRPX_44515 [Streptomyces sp. NPDC101225]|uniref:hypothetical protein n=1 Tax=Streptomyces sp. NPDC101225 TaxID=3366135 RepID=UPI0037F50B49
MPAAGRPHPAGVDGQASALLLDPHGNQGLVHTTLFSDTPATATATVAGTHATLSLPGPFHQPGDIALTLRDGTRLGHTEGRTGHDALPFEAAEVARCIAAGRLQTPLRPLADSATTLRAMDDIRRRCGIVFPTESPQPPGTA